MFPVGDVPIMCWSFGDVLGWDVFKDVPIVCWSFGDVPVVCSRASRMFP